MLSKSIQKKVLRALSREPRLHNRVFEMRAVIEGVSIYSCDTDVNRCREIFFYEIVKKILQVSGADFPKQKKKSNLFTDFAGRWFEEIHAKKVLAKTCSRDLSVYKKHIAPYFSGRILSEITSADCIRFGLHMKEKGIGRTAEQCDGILRQIFDYAEAEERIKKNPMDKLKRVKSVRENGVPLTKAEERGFLQSIRGTKHEAVFLLMLFCGLRPCEVSSARIEGEFIVAQNRKQKDVDRIVFKKIPITPMLERYLDILQASLDDLPTLTKSETYMGELFRKHCPGRHRLYDLRTTFSTRAQECGVPENVVQKWMGHSAKTLLGKVYTKFSDEYLLTEGKKINY